MNEAADEPPELMPEGTGAGIWFLVVIALTTLLVIVQLTTARQYVWLGAFVIVLGGAFLAFLGRVSRSPRAGENNSEEQK